MSNLTFHTIELTSTAHSCAIESAVAVFDGIHQAVVATGLGTDALVSPGTHGAGGRGAPPAEIPGAPAAARQHAWILMDAGVVQACVELLLVPVAMGTTLDDVERSQSLLSARRGAFRLMRLDACDG